MAAKTVDRPPPAATPFFRDIRGQQRPLGFLKNALRAGQLPHALLFLGPRGVGKTMAALSLAQTLNCATPLPEIDACGICPSCRRFAGGNHPDLLVISPQGEGLHPQIKIDQIRALRRQLDFRPHVGPWRVILIQSADSLNEAAANALLKTLEEPPEGNVLVLTAVGEGDLLPTIVSRCRRLTFSFLPLPVLREILGPQARQPAAAALLAALSFGSPGRALSLNAEEMVARRDEVLADLETLAAPGPAHVLDWAAAGGKKAAELEDFILLARLWYRDLLAVACKIPDHALINQDRLDELHRHARTLSIPVLLSRLDLLAALDRQLRANLNVELALDAFGLQFQAAVAPEYVVTL